MRNKLTSRKFWISIAAFLGSIGTSIAGIVTGEKWITVVGTVCAMLSAAIYAAVEAYCDGNCVDQDRVDKFVSVEADGSTCTTYFKDAEVDDDK